MTRFAVREEERVVLLWVSHSHSRSKVRVFVLGKEGDLTQPLTTKEVSDGSTPLVARTTIREPFQTRRAQPSHPTKLLRNACGQGSR